MTMPIPPQGLVENGLKLAAEAPVIIEANVEDMAARTERIEIPRAEWNAMTPAQRRQAIDDIAAETLSNAGGYGAIVADDSAPDSDLDDLPTTPAEARTGISDTVAAALNDVADLRTMCNNFVEHELLDRIERALKARQEDEVVRAAQRWYYEHGFKPSYLPRNVLGSDRDLKLAVENLARQEDAR